MAATTPTSKSSKAKKAIRVRSARHAEADKSVPQVGSELWTLTVDYAKQEIRDPLKGLGTYVVWGTIAMLLVGIGSVLVALGGLRALQTETGTAFAGNWSWAPYGIVLIGALVVLAFFALFLIKRKK